MIINEFFEKGIYYSWKLAIYNSAWWIGNYCHPLVKLQFWAKDRITQWTNKYISNNGFLPQYRINSEEDIDTYYFWVFWWQGEDSMPELVKGCFLQLSSHNENVTLVTKDNIRSYCNIPDYIFDKVDKGLISLTHFSDIVRVSLLAEHGGMWIDSTCWTINKIPQDINNRILISPKTINVPDFPWWSNSRWCGWCMGTNKKNNPLFVFTRDFFYIFYKHNSRIPFYLFIDYLYDYAYRNFKDVRRMFDSIPENNLERGQLHFCLNKSWDYEQYLRLTKNTWVFKLSYKSLWKHENAGQTTFYAQLIGKAIANNEKKDWIR